MPITGLLVEGNEIQFDNLGYLIRQMLYIIKNEVILQKTEP